MAKVAVNYKIDEELKQRVDKILDHLDITPTMVVTGLYHYIDHNLTLPFLIKTQSATPEELKETLINLCYGAMFHLQSIYAKTPENANTEMMRLNHCINQIRIFTRSYLKRIAEQTNEEENTMIHSLLLSLERARTDAHICNEKRLLTTEETFGMHKAGMKMGMDLLSDAIYKLENE